MRYRIRYVNLETRAELRTPGIDPPVRGAYVKKYDPEFAGGRGLVEWTTKKDEAVAFDDMRDAIEFYRQVSLIRPLRPDGKPNRPLTSCSVEFERSDE